MASAEGAYNSISEKTDPKLSFLASDTWGDWGGLVSFSTARRTNRTDSESGINFRPLTRFLATSTGARGAQAQAVLARDAGVVVQNRANTAETDRIIFQDKVGDRALSEHPGPVGRRRLAAIPAVVQLQPGLRRPDRPLRDDRGPV